MIVDFDEKTVTFRGDTTLSLAQLWSLIELMDDEVSDDEGLLAKLHPAPEPVAFARNIYEVRSFSDSRHRYVVVEFETGAWACSCPDWINRKSLTGEFCKHIIYKNQAWPVWR